ncbi:MAG: aromatic ring-hydroxylating oxygenase subunit alpha [Sphingomonadaceae bacterium]
MEWNDIKALVDDRVGEGWFSVHRDAFTSDALFDHEIAHVFEGGWVFLGMACQAPGPHDFFTTTIGRTPVVVMRDGKGALGAFVNSCPHKGATICQTRRGHGRVHVCPYHSWTFDSAGRNVAVKAAKAGAYSPAFDAASHDLARLPAFADYRGFLFGSLVETCPIEEHLGEARHFLDVAADQGEDGLELVPGEVIFTYDGNWKMQLENCADPYHFTSVHPSYVRLIEKRNAEKIDNAVKSVWGKDAAWSEMTGGITGGTFAFDEGHVVNWQIIPLSDAVPLAERAEALAQRYGKARRDWMVNMRNLTIFPNMQLAENASSQLRIIRPLAAGKTEMRTFCIAPKGESDGARAQRIRNYEDFFNPTGMATPDDAICYEAAQRGHGGSLSPWLLGYARGMQAMVAGGDAHAAQLPVNPARSVPSDSQLCDETLFHSYYRSWLARLQKGLGA